jgi:Uma2 family endonuclease
MPRGDRHGFIVNALAFALTPAARRLRCQLFTYDMKVRLNIANQTVFYYPDLLLSCDPADREAYFCASPCLIVEALSDSTEQIDRRANGWLPDCARSGEIRLDCLDTTVAVGAIDADVDKG